MLYRMLVMWRAKQKDVRAHVRTFSNYAMIDDCFDRRGCGDRGKNTCNTDFVCGADEAVPYTKAAW